MVLRAGGLTGLMNQPTAQVIDGSLKFQKANSTSLTRTPGSAGNRSVYTGSVWLKRTQFAPDNTGNSNTHNHIIFSAGTNSGNNVDDFSYYKNAGGDDNKLRFQSYPGSTQYEVISDAKYRDPNGWYNIVWNYDGTTARIYVNGEELTSLDTNTQNGGSGGHLNNTVQHVIGRTCDLQNSGEFDGYMSQFYWIDGLKLGPSYFGFTDPLTNTWRPKKFRAEGTTVNDGTTWSTTCTFSRPTSGFDGLFNTANAAYLSSAGTGTITTAPFTIKNNLRIYNNARSDQGGRYTVTINGIPVSFDGTGSSSTAYRWTDIDLSGFSLPIRVTNLQYTVPGSSGTGFDAVEVDGVLMLDSTTTNLDFGTNGFYLPMDNQDDFEKDKSGNGNDFTKNNFSGTSINPDVVKDSPSGAVFGGRAQTGITTTSSAPANYATWNPLWLVTNSAGNNSTFSNGNLTGTTSNSATSGGLGTIGVSSGKWYFEITCGAFTGGTGLEVGVAKENLQSTISSSEGGGTSADGYFYINDGRKVNNNSASSYGASYTDGDVISVFLNLDAGSISFHKNGADQGTAYTGLSGVYYPAFSDYNDSGTSACTLNCGQKPFKYAPPQGFLPLNFADVRPNKVVPRPDQYVGVTTFTGNGSTQSIDVGHEPDLIWLKDRDDGEHHGLFDTIRGPLMRITSDYNYASTSRANTVTSFNDNGVTLGSAGEYNGSDDAIVAWSWKAGGSKNTFNVDDVGYASAAAAGLDGGTITPTGASVGTKQGFSIIKFTNTTSDSTQSHGLTQKPDFIIWKKTSGTSHWGVYHSAIGATKVLYLNLNNAAATGSEFWNNTEPTSSLVTTRAEPHSFGSAGDTIMYLWHDVPGLQKFGKFYGSRSGAQDYVHLGFKPAVVWLKRTDNTGNWAIFDDQKSNFNTNFNHAIMNGTPDDQGQATGDGIDILSNGFAVRSTNAYTSTGSQSYIYCAWASMPTSTVFGGQSNTRRG